MDNRDVYIYALIDPRDNSVNYVGRTVNMESRFKSHISPSEFGLKSTRMWIGSLAQDGLKPIMKTLEVVRSGKNWAIYENKWISYYRDTGSPLKNRMVNRIHHGSKKPKSTTRSETVLQTPRLRIREHRWKKAANMGKNLSLRQVSEETGISSASLRKLDIGDFTILNMESVKTLLRYFDLEDDELLELLEI